MQFSVSGPKGDLIEGGTPKPPALNRKERRRRSKALKRNGQSGEQILARRAQVQKAILRKQRGEEA